jgi:hypothetical protein
MSITDLLDHPFYYSSVSTASAEVPARWHVGLAGVGYMLDLQLVEMITRSADAFQHTSIPLIRQQADASNQPGEQSINPEDLWRRSAEEWHAGAGQNYYDRSFSTVGRYRASQGIDPSVFGQISLLPATGLVLDSANTNLKLAVAGTYLYVIDGPSLKYTPTLAFPSTWTTVTGYTAPVSLCSDGHRVYFTSATDVFMTTKGTATAAVFHSGPLAAQTLARYVKGRLLTAGGPALYDNGASGSAAPAALYTHPNSDWTWTDISEGPNAIYLAGFSGDKSLIYQTAVKPDGTALDIPQVAGELPDGEIVRSVQGYLGFLMIGSDKGVRFANVSTTGALSTIGDLIPTDDPVKGFEPQDRFVWYCGTTNGGGSSLGRVNLEFLNGSAPSYWNDLAVAGAHVPATSVVTYSGKRVFSTLQGVYAETSSKVSGGSLTSGYIGYNLPDDKTALQIITRHAGGAGSYTVSLAVDDSPTAPLGPPIQTAASNASGSILATNLKGALFEVTLTLMRDLSDPTSGPVLRRWTLRSSPAAQRRRTIVVPLLLHQTIDDLTGHTQYFDPLASVADIAALADSGQVVTYQEMSRAYQVIVMDYHWVPHQMDPKHNWGGTCSVHLGTV